MVSARAERFASRMPRLRLARRHSCLTPRAFCLSFVPVPGDLETPCSCVFSHRRKKIHGTGDRGRSSDGYVIICRSHATWHRFPVRKLGATVECPKCGWDLSTLLVADFWASAAIAAREGLSVAALVV